MALRLQRVPQHNPSILFGIDAQPGGEHGVADRLGDCEVAPETDALPQREGEITSGAGWFAIAALDAAGTGLVLFARRRRRSTS